MKSILFSLIILAGTAFRAGGETDAYREAVTCYGAGLYEKALALLEEEGEAVDPETQAGRLNLQGAAHFKLKQWDQARTCFEAAIGMNPELSQVRFNLAEVHFALQQYEQALPLYIRARDSGPEVEFKIILCRFFTGDEDLALEDISRLEPSSETPLFYYAHAVKHYLAGHFEKYTYFVTAAQAVYPAEKRAFYEQNVLEQGWKLPQSIY